MLLCFHRYVPSSSLNRLVNPFFQTYPEPSILKTLIDLCSFPTHIILAIVLHISLSFDNYIRSFSIFYSECPEKNQSPFFLFFFLLSASHASSNLPVGAPFTQLVALAVLCALPQPLLRIFVWSCPEHCSCRRPECPHASIIRPIRRRLQNPVVGTFTADRRPPTKPSLEFTALYFQRSLSPSSSPSRTVGIRLLSHARQPCFLFFSALFTVGSA